MLLKSFFVIDVSTFGVVSASTLPTSIGKSFSLIVTLWQSTHIILDRVTEKRTPVQQARRAAATSNGRGGIDKRDMIYFTKVGEIEDGATKIKHTQHCIDMLDSPVSVAADSEDVEGHARHCSEYLTS